VLDQAGRVVDFGQWKRVFVACSGSFKIERFLAQKWPDLEITGNDVSLLSCALGGLAAGSPVAFRFKDELAWLEPAREEADDVGRAALLMIALNASTYASGKPNRYKLGHLDQIKARLEPLAQAARDKFVKALDELHLVDFQGGDFAALGLQAARDGSGVISFPPTYRGGYERQYRFLSANVEWTQPSYDVFDPADLSTYLNKLDATQAPWLVFCDQAIEGREPVTEFRAGRAKPIYGYGNTAQRAALRRKRPSSQPFDYKQLDVAKLGPRSKVALVPASSAQANYVKDIFLAKHIKHSPGMANLLVYVDDMLAGLIIYSLSRHQVYSADEIYLLSDLSTSREGRISKLIARLALSGPVISWLESRFLRRFGFVVTTAFAKNPVSMKYRGVFDLLKRVETPGGFMLNYGKPVTREKLDTAYRWWWREHGSKINVG
jgi:hypothetical protein